MKSSVVLAKREAILRLLADEAVGRGDDGGTRARLLGPMVLGQRPRGWVSSVLGGLGQALRRRSLADIVPATSAAALCLSG